MRGVFDLVLAGQTRWAASFELQLASPQKSQDGAAELDADWDSSHDGFKHQSFEHVIQALLLTVVPH